MTDAGDPAPTDPTEQPAPSSANKLFDVRSVIGGLFVFYGLVVTVTGIVDSDAAKEQAAGIAINLWAGLGMLAFGIGMLGWLRLSPTE